MSLLTDYPSLMIYIQKRFIQFTVLKAQEHAALILVPAVSQYDVWYLYNQLSRCWDNIPDTKQRKGRRVYLFQRSLVQSMQTGIAQQREHEVTGHIESAFTEYGDADAQFTLFFLFNLRCPSPQHIMLQPTFKVGLPSSVKLFSKSPLQIHQEIRFRGDPKPSYVNSRRLTMEAWWCKCVQD